MAIYNIDTTNIIVSTFCTVPYEEASNNYIWHFVFSIFHPHTSCLHKGGNKNCPNESLFLSPAVFSSIFTVESRNYIVRQRNSKLVLLWINLKLLDLRGR